MSSKLNILIITHYNLYPIESGGAQATMSYLSEMQHLHQLSILITNPFVPSVEQLKELQTKLPLVNIITAEPPIDSFLNRFKQKVKQMLTRMGFMGSGPATMIDNAQHHYLPLNHEDYKLIKKATENQRFDVIEVNFLEKFPVIYALPKDSVKVAVNHEPRFRRTKGQCKEGLLEKPYGEYLHSYQEAFECTLMDKYDAVVCFNMEDVGLIQEQIEKPVYHAPIAPAASDIVHIEPLTNKIKHVFFLGGGHHHPNYLAVEWYKNELGQLIFNKLGVKLEVVGDWTKEMQKALASPYIKFSGFVENLDAYSDNSIMLVPVKTGGGIRTKIQWAMSKGIPVVSTAFGHEGIPCIDGESFLEAEDAKTFLRAIELLLSDNELRNNIRKNANALIKEHFSPEKIAQIRSNIYHDLVANKFILE